MNLLIVDDELLCRKGMSEVVAKHRPDIHVFTAGNGLEALDIIRSTPIDGMFLDVRMPKCDGFELLDYLKEENINDIITVIVSGINDFEYARNAIKSGVFEYLLKPITPSEMLQSLDGIVSEVEKRNREQAEVNQLRNLVSKNRKAMQLQLFSDVLSGLVDEEELLRRGRLLDVPLNSRTFMCIAFEVLRGDDCSSAQHHMNVSTCETALETLLNRYPEARLFHTNMDRFTILLCSNEEDIDVQPLLDDIAALDLGFEHAVGLSSVCHRTDDIGRCHAESVRALRFNTLFGEKTSVTSPRSYYVPDYNRFSILLSNGEIDKLKAILHETLDNTAINSPSGSVSTFALACNELLLMLCKALHERGIDVSAYFPAGNLHLLFPDNLTQLKDVRRWFDTILDEASKQLDTRTKQAVSHLILNICRFVETHYAEPINNSIIADKFGYSPNYLGKIFREETDTNLNDYIKDIRIEKAKSLLSETSLRIADIAVQAGFSDSQYFSVVFRQKTGCTPKEYREMHK